MIPPAAPPTIAPTFGESDEYSWVRAKGLEFCVLVTLARSGEEEPLAEELVEDRDIRVIEGCSVELDIEVLEGTTGVEIPRSVALTGEDAGVMMVVWQVAVVSIPNLSEVYS